MSANSKPLAPITIREWLANASDQLNNVGIQSARLDAQLIVSFVLQRDRSWLVAHDDNLLPAALRKSADELLVERANHVPLAYLFAYKEFYGRNFWVTPDVLIPRPETEEMIELALRFADPAARMIDVGTGSGAIAVTLAAELPHVKMEACDISEAALTVARFNNQLVDNRVKLFHSDLLDETESLYGMILGNLPYVARGFEISPDAYHEPAVALFAEDEGYALIERLIPQAAASLLRGGYLVLESDPWQQDRIVETARAAGFQEAARRRFHVVLRRN